jgi:hypothetical protein
MRRGCGVTVSRRARSGRSSLTVKKKRRAETALLRLGGSPTSPQSGRRAWQQRSIRSQKRLSALHDPGKTVPPQSRCHVKPMDGQAFTAFPRVRSSEAFGRRPYAGSTLAPGRHPKPFPKTAVPALAWNASYRISPRCVSSPRRRCNSRRRRRQEPAAPPFLQRLPISAGGLPGPSRNRLSAYDCKPLAARSPHTSFLNLPGFSRHDYTGITPRQAGRGEGTPTTKAPP